MAVSQADIDALNTAIAKGVRSVSIDGHNVIYNTGESLMKARDDMVRQLAAQNAAAAVAAGVARKSKQTYAVYAGRDFD